MKGILHGDFIKRNGSRVKAILVDMEPPETVNKGETSPRWAFMKRFTIPSRLRDADYLYRLRLIDCNWFGVYVHVIAGPDEDPHLHNHPATFRSFIIAGAYVEEWTQTANPRLAIKRGHDRFSWNIIRWGEFHRIVALDGPVWTIVFRGRRKSSWGFLVDRGHIVDYSLYLDPAKYGSW